MAQLLNYTRFKSPSTAVATVDITIPATSANSKLVVVAAGGATIQAKLGVGGSNFTQRTNSLDNRQVIAQDIVDASGGTTTIEFALNGAENIDGVIYEFATGTLGNFLTGAAEASNATDAQGQVATGSITTVNPAVIFMMFTAADNFSTAARKFWGMEPVGRQDANEYIQNDPSKSKYWSMIGISDQNTPGTFTGISSHVQGSTHQSVIWAYENLDTGTPTYTNPYPTAIAAENSRPGSLYASWFGGDTSPNIAGYTDSISYLPGDTVNFKVDSNNVGFIVQIYRVGGYGYVAFAGKYQTTVTGTPAAQPSPTIDSYGGTVCAWSTTATWAIPSTATTGVYAYNMRRSDNLSFLAQGLFVVRGTPPVTQGSKIALVTADFTWQAYNVWGATTDSGSGYGGFTGRSLYGTAPSSINNASRAFAASYDRPFGTVSANSITYFWDSEAGLVNFLELNGYDIDYYTSVDLERDPTILSKYKIAISSGHDEYWSVNRRDAFENARDAGTNLMFFSSNTSLWHVRFDPADTNFRKMICYKDSHNTTGYDNTTTYDPITYTGTWRDIRTTVGGVNNTNRRPESGMTGQWFIGNGTFVGRAVVPDSYKSLPAWRNTRIASGSTISVRGTNSNSITTAGTSGTLDQPVATQIGDLLIVAATFTSANPGFDGNGLYVVRQTTDANGLTTVILQSYANLASNATFTFTWNATCLASFSIVAYANAVWQDTDSSIIKDDAGGATHTTRSMLSGNNDRWAVCVFGDATSSNGTATTSWTPGAGLTLRAQADNSAAGTGPWSSVAIMDTNGAVSQALHQYSATAQFANSRAAAGIMYISPGQPLYASTIGAEWDYVKADEPSTPTNMVMLSTEAVPLRGQAANYNGNSYGGNGTFIYGYSLYKAASGALVFNSGSWRYTWGISRIRGGATDINGIIDPAMQQMVINLVRDMAQSPVTLLGTVGNNDATALVDPGAAASPAAYGFDVTSTQYQSIFPAATEPQNLDSSDGNDYNLGTLFSADADGKIHGVRWYFPGTLPDASVVGVLYSWTSDAAGTELARVTFHNPQTGWNEALFAAPVDIAANTKYLVSVWTSDHFVSSVGTFASAGIANGNLTAPQDVSGAHNGKFLVSAGSPSYPTSTFGSNCYFADVLFVGSATLLFEGWGLPMN